MDTDALRAIMQFARDVPKAYLHAKPAMQKQYLQFFFKEFVVEDKRLVKAVCNEFFASLLDKDMVRSSTDWLATPVSNPKSDTNGGF